MGAGTEVSGFGNGPGSSALVAQPLSIVAERYLAPARIAQQAARRRSS
ncbi:hypothetical protein [Thetidibacter halocola]|nr:hypothetical protein [Thetidibacter halocola]